MFRHVRKWPVSGVVWKVAVGRATFEAALVHLVVGAKHEARWSTTVVAPVAFLLDLGTSEHPLESLHSKTIEIRG